MQMTLYVFAFVVIMALFLWFTDKTVEGVVRPDSGLEKIMTDAMDAGASGAGRRCP
jgi:hypothetical protein